MRLVGGALAIAGDLPSTRTTVIEVPVEAGDALGTRVDRLSSIIEVTARHATALDAVTAGDGAAVPVTIGGDCGVALAAVAHSLRHDSVAVVWFDAHPDLHTPASTGSRAFAGMVLRTLLGDGLATLAPTPPLAASRVVLAGARSIDDAEAEAIDSLGIPVIACPIDRTVDGADFTHELVAAVAATGASRVHIHIDVDVLDPAEFASKDSPEPFGLAVTTLTGAIRALTSEFELIGASTAEFAPSNDEDAAGDLATILRIIGALAGGARS